MKQIFLLIILTFISLTSFAWNSPVLVSPSNGISIWAGYGFNWNAVTGSSNYEIQIDTSSSFNSPAFQKKIETYINSSNSNSDTYEFLSDMYFGKTYFWRVRAWIPGDTSAWVTRTFQTRDDVNLVSPSNNTNIWAGYGFNWDAHDGVDFYEIQIDTNSNFNSVAFLNHIENYINTSNSNPDTYEFLSDMYFGENYFWRVRAINAVDTSEWVTRTFQTRDDVNLVSPSNNTNIWAGYGFNWDAHDGVDFYEIQIDTNSNFNSIAFQNHIENYINTSNNNSDTYEFLSDMYFGENYFWRVRAINAVDTSEWVTRTFQTRDDVNLVSPGNNTNIWAGYGFNWDAHDGVDFYEIQIDTNSNFNSIAFQNHIENYINTSNNNSDTYEFLSDMYFGENYFWRVRAINAVDTSEWTTRTFQTRDDVNLVSPSNNTNIWAGYGFNWDAHDGVDFYEIQIDTNSNFNSIAFQNHVENYINTSNSNPDTYEFLSDMYFGENYFWRVRAINAVDTSEWTTRTFQTRDFVNLVSPSNLSLNQSISGVGFNWNAHDGVDFYELQWDTTNLFNSSILQSQIENYINTSDNNSDTYHHSGTLLSNQTYFWRVRAINLVDTSDWQNRIFSTGTGIIIPQIPTLVSPINGATALINPINFNWNNAVNAQSYEIQYDFDASFINPISNQTNNSNFNVNNLILDSLYFWRVRSINNGFYSAWSDVWSFKMNHLNCNSTNSYINPVVCSSYVSPSGKIFTATGNYLDTIPNSKGCDSLILINLTIQSSTSSSISPVECSQYISPSGKIFTTTGNYLDTISNSKGCDSLILINLTIQSSTSSSISPVECSQYISPSGKIYTTSGNYLDTISNSKGCDSLILINLTIHSTSSSSISPVECSQYISPSGKIFTTSGNYLDTILNSKGCDSLILINLTIHSSTSSSISPVECSRYISPSGKIFTTSGNYLDTISNSQGCDSLININLVINTVDVSILNNSPTLVSNANNASYQWIDCNQGNMPISGETNQSFTASLNGNYAVIISQNNCIDTSDCIMISNVSIFENDLNKNVKIYPNPSDGLFFVDMSNIYNVESISVNNALGQVIYQNKIQNESKILVEIENKKGMYFIEIKLKNQETIRRKLLIN